MLHQHNISISTIENKAKVIEFYHPKANSMSSLLLAELCCIIQDLEKNDEIEIIVFTSRGESIFCAGANFDELTKIDNEIDAIKFFMGFANLINTIRKSSKLIVGKINGHAIGGGVGLIAAFDIAFSTEKSTMRLSEINIGIGPFVISPALERKIGLSAWSQMSIQPNKSFSATWAYNVGLIANVLPDSDSLDEHIEDYIRSLLTTGYSARKELKKQFWKDCKHWDSIMAELAQISGKLLLQEDTKNKIQRLKLKS